MAHKREEILSKIKIQGQLDPEIFGQIAKDTVDFLMDSHGSDSKENNPSQIRRFYDELALWHDKIESKGIAKDQMFEEALPYIQMIKAKLAYARGRELLSEDFFVVFSQLISDIKSPKSLKNAKLFFEAYMGFAKAMEQAKEELKRAKRQYQRNSR